MRRSLILGALYVLLVVVVALSAPFGFTLSRRLTDELGGQVEREAFAVAASFEDQLERGQLDGLQALTERLAAQIGGRVLITDATGVLVADSLQPPGSRPPSYASRDLAPNVIAEVEFGPQLRPGFLPILRDQDERREEDRLQAHDHSEQTEGKRVKFPSPPLCS
jgi:hypothetical protein